MSGGEGFDKFYFTTDQIDDAIDVITDFNKSEDKIVIQGGIEIIADNDSLFLGYKGFELEVQVGALVPLADILINEI